MPEEVAPWSRVASRSFLHGVSHADPDSGPSVTCSYNLEMNRQIVSHPNGYSDAFSNCRSKPSGKGKGHT